MEKRRKHRRYSVPAGKVLIFNHFSTKVGWITNVSEGGLSFECKRSSGLEVDPEVIDIFSYEFDKFFIPAVPCRKVYENNLAETETIRCGLQFGRLDKEIKGGIDALLKRLEKEMQ